MSEDQYGHREHQRDGKVEPETVTGIGTHGLKVAMPHKQAHPDRQGSRQARQYHVEQLRQRDSHLMGGKRDGAQPTHHDTAETESSTLHPQL